MYKYNETELTDKINMFLTKKSLKFPDLYIAQGQSSLKHVTKDQKESRFFITIDKLNTFWAQQIHP